MRKSINSLAEMVKQTFEMNSYSDSLFLFYGGRGIGLKHFMGKMMDLFLCTSVLKVANFSCYIKQRKLEYNKPLKFDYINGLKNNILQRKE